MITFIYIKTVRWNILSRKERSKISINRAKVEGLHLPFEHGNNHTKSHTNILDLSFLTSNQFRAEWIGASDETVWSFKTHYKHQTNIGYNETTIPAVFISDLIFIQHFLAALVSNNQTFWCSSTSSLIKSNKNQIVVSSIVHWQLVKNQQLSFTFPHFANPNWNTFHDEIRRNE
jgi:hypothetical protein